MKKQYSTVIKTNSKYTIQCRCYIMPTIDGVMVGLSKLEIFNNKSESIYHWYPTKDCITCFNTANGECYSYEPVISKAFNHLINNLISLDIKHLLIEVKRIVGE